MNAIARPWLSMVDNLTPPSGVPPPAMAPMTPPPVAPQKPPQVPRKRGLTWLGVGLGCGCLFIVLSLTAGIYAVKCYYDRSIAPIVREHQQQQQPQPATPPQSTSTSALRPAATLPDPKLAVKPALAPTPGWVGKTVYVSPDHQRVKVWVGPPNSEYTNALVMQWDGANGKYVVESTKGIEPYEPPAAKPQAKPKPKATAKPSQSGVIKAALGQVEHGWVAKVTRHSADWTYATVAVGPPASEWVGEIDVKWTGRRYKITGNRGG